VRGNVVQRLIIGKWLVDTPERPSRSPMVN
jgi:hypothetical protein